MNENGNILTVDSVSEPLNFHILSVETVQVTKFFQHSPHVKQHYVIMAT